MLSGSGEPVGLSKYLSGNARFPLAALLLLLVNRLAAATGCIVEIANTALRLREIRPLLSGKQVFENREVWTESRRETTASIRHARGGVLHSLAAQRTWASSRGRRLTPSRSTPFSEFGRSSSAQKQKGQESRLSRPPLSVRLRPKGLPGCGCAAPTYSKVVSPSRFDSCLGGALLNSESVRARKRKQQPCPNKPRWGCKAPHVTTT